MMYSDLVRSTSLSEDEARSLIAAHQRELTDTENSYLDKLAEKNRTISDLQAEIDALKASAAQAKAIDARARTYEPPVIQVVNFNG